MVTTAPTVSTAYSYTCVCVCVRKRAVLQSIIFELFCLLCSCIVRVGIKSDSTPILNHQSSLNFSQSCPPSFYKLFVFKIHTHLLNSSKMMFKLAIATLFLVGSIQCVSALELIKTNYFPFDSTNNQSTHHLSICP